MSESVTITSPVKIEQTSNEAIALDLMRIIAAHENEEKDREYFLSLYKECRKATYGR